MIFIFSFLISAAEGQECGGDVEFDTQVSPAKGFTKKNVNEQGSFDFNR